MDGLRECYRILEVEPGASLDDVKRSYRELVKVWHPDRFDHDPKLREKAVEKLKQINLAYERLSAAGASYSDGDTASARQEDQKRRQHRRASENEYAYARREPPPPPPEPQPARSDAWIHRFVPLVAGTGAAVIVAVLVWYLTPEPEPRFLIDLPPEPTAAGAPQTGAKASRPRPRLVAPPTFVLPPRQIFFGKGSTKEEVIAAQGRPDSATDKLFRYGTSDVHFEDGKVISWRNGFPRLKVKMAAALNLGGRTYFTVGSTKDQVIDAQGTPDAFTDTSFTYGTSKVYFSGGRVTSWRVHDRPLNAKLLPKTDVGSPTHFTVGSSKDEVLAVQGTPDAFDESKFDYGTSRVYFDKGKVSSWDSRHPPLRAR
jgi:hypothetical protein